VDAVQGEANTRQLQITLFSNNTTWTPPAGTTAAVAFLKPDGTRGLYDKLPNGTPATTLSGNTVTAILAPQVLTCAGTVLASIVFYDKDQDTLATFPFKILVEKNPAAGEKISNNYYTLQNLDQVNAAYAALLDEVAYLQSQIDTILDSGGNANLSGTEKNLILTLFRNAAYTSGNMNATLTQLENIWSGSGDVPVNPEKTLSSISAVYSGGSVTAGTAVSALTGIVVTAHYSDGTSATVTGYTLSGTIAEGSNTITVSYGGKTTTFTVVGVATEVSNETEWHNGVAYTFEPIANEYPDKSTGAITTYSNWARSPYLYCAGASILRGVVKTKSSQFAATKDNAFYDADKNYVAPIGGTASFAFNSLADAEVGTHYDVQIPENAAYFIVSGNNTMLPIDGEHLIEYVPYE
jgi:hypothetical protein